MRLIFCLALSLIASPAIAQMEAPQPINTPLAKELRAPFMQFLRDFHVDDLGNLINKTFALPLRGTRHPDAILFRIEDASTCGGDLCLTVIGHVVGDKLHVDAMFNAGNRITRVDNAKPFLGLQDFPSLLIGDTSTVTLFDTPSGWLVISEPTQK